MKKNDLVKSLKEYYSGHDTRNFEVLDFIGAFGSPLLAIGYAKLFWPEFEEFEGMVFLSECLDEDAQKNIRALLGRSHANGKEIEKSFNLFEIPSYFFGKSAGDTNDTEDEHLAEIIAQTWKCRLNSVFPNKRFCVEIVPSEESGGEIAVIFYQE